MSVDYPSDINRDVFETKLLPILRRARKTTKPITVDLYHIFNGILYVLKSGCQWRMLPKDFPKWRTCYDYWQKWSAKRESLGVEHLSFLEEALKKSGWRGSTKPGGQR